MEKNRKPEIMKGLLTLKRKTYITPHYISIVLEGTDLNNFNNAVVGDNNKILIAAKGTKEIVFPEPRGEGAAGVVGTARAATTNKSIMRTYTLRKLDLEKQEMTIEFVAHGTEGPASAWAIAAEPGDQLGVMMKRKEKSTFQQADWYLLTGDHTALPVISVMIEAMQGNAAGEVIIEVHGPEDVIPMSKPSNVNIIWLFNRNPGSSSHLPEVFRKIQIPAEKSKFVFAAAESKAVLEIQELLKNDHRLERNEWKAYSYWKYGQSEETSSGERKTIRNSISGNQ